MTRPAIRKSADGLLATGKVPARLPDLERFAAAQAFLGKAVAVVYSPHRSRDTAQDHPGRVISVARATFGQADVIVLRTPTIDVAISLATVLAIVELEPAEAATLDAALAARLRREVTQGGTITEADALAQAKRAGDTLAAVMASARRHGILPSVGP